MPQRHKALVADSQYSALGTRKTHLVRSACELRFGRFADWVLLLLSLKSWLAVNWKFYLFSLKTLL